MPKKTPSPAHQVSQLWKHFDGSGESRHAAKQEMTERGQKPQAMGEKMHSKLTYRKELGGAIAFARWCKAKHGMKYLREIQPPWVSEYIEMRKQMVKPNTVAGDLTAIRRLDKCLQAQVPERESIIPKGVKAPRQDSPRGAYIPAEAQAIIAYVEQRNPLAADVLRAQLSGGLRIREAITLRPDKIDFRNGIVETLGKGGKIRQLEPMDKQVLDGLDLYEKFPLRPGADENGLKLKENSWMRDIQALVRAACLKLGIQPRGTHAFRATATTSYYKSLLTQGMAKPDALAASAEWLGHGPDRLDVLRKYLGDELVDDALQSDIVGRDAVQEGR